jgi:RING finger/CCCH-type zinc finger protein
LNVALRLQLQSPQSFGQSITELTLALTRTGDPGNLFALRRHLELLANVDPNAGNQKQ